MSSGSPPTLWWLLITAAVPSVPPLSIDVGVERALHEELGVGQAAGVLLEDADEQLADRLALRLRFGDAGEALEEAVAGVDVDQLDAHVAAERLDDLLALALAHQAGVDVDARELMPDRRGGRAPRRPPSRPRRDSAQITRSPPTWCADAARPARR